MNFQTIATIILLTTLTTQTKCPDATLNSKEDPRFKIGFEIETVSLRIIKDKVSKVIARNSEIKTDKFHIDTLMTKKTNSFWYLKMTVL